MATGKIANLTVGIAADAAEFTNGLNKAEAQAEAFRKRLEVKTIAIGTAIGQGLAGVARELAQAIPAIFNGAADALDAFNDLRDVTGESVESLSGLASLGARTGASFDTVSSSLVKFNKLLKDAGDNAQGDIFRSLGLDLDKLKNMSSVEALQETAKALANLNDNSAKSRVILELFGKSAAEIAPLLNDVAAAGTLVASVTTEQAQAAEDYNKAVFTLKANVQDAVNTFVATLLPTLTEVVKYLNSAATSSTGFGEAAVGAFREVAKAGADIGFVFSSIGREIGAIAAQAEALGVSFVDMARGPAGIASALADAALKGESSWSRFSAIGDAVSADSARARVELDDFKRRVDMVGKSLSDLGVPEASYSNEGRTSAAASTKKDAPDLDALERERKAREAAAKAAASAADAAASAYARQEEHARKYVDALDKQITKAQDLTTVEKVLDDIANQRVKFSNAASAGAAIGKASEVDASKRLTEQLAFEASEWERINKARQSRAAAISDSVLTDQEKYTASVKELIDLQAQGYITQDTMTKAIDAQGVAYTALIGKANEAATAQSTAADQASRNIQDALGKTIVDSSESSFKEILNNWANMLRQMVAQALAADVMEKITGKGSSNNTSNLVNGIIGLFAGSAGSAYNGGGTYQNGSYTEGTSLLPGLATGTNYVPYDGFKAALHKGEAVVPAKYNPANGGASGASAPIINNYGAQVETERKENGQLEITVRNMVRSTVVEDFSRGGQMAQFGSSQFGWKRQNPRR